MNKKPDDHPKEQADLEAAFSSDSLKGKTPDELRSFVERLDARLKAIYQEDSGAIRSLTSDEQSAFDAGLKVRDEGLQMLEDHRRIASIFERTPKSVESVFNIIKGQPDDRDLDVRHMTSYELHEAATRKLDGRHGRRLRPDQLDEINDRMITEPKIAGRIVLTENDAYRSAWQKAVTDAAPIYTDEERHALLTFKDYERAGAESPTSAGGFGIPVFIDPSIILTAQGSGNPFLALARQVTVNTNLWKGVSSAGVTWAFQAEAAATTDNMATLAQPSVTVYMARGFIPYSIEIGMDYPAFAQEMSTLLAAGYDELLVDKFTRGAGSTEPNGILTQLSANTNVRVTLTTVAVLGAPDPYKVWAAVPQRFRNQPNTAWLMSVATNNSIRQLGTANVYHAFTESLPANWADQLFGKRVYESPYMPDTTTSTTAPIGLAVVGDFSNYVIARNGGMSVELIPALFDVTNNRPTGQRGWFAYARIGGNSVNDLGFRLLVNS